MLQVFIKEENVADEPKMNQLNLSIIREFFC